MNTHTALLDLMRGLPEYRQLVAEAQRDGPRVVSLYGVSHIHKAHIAATLLADLGRPVCVITRDEQSARRMALDIEGFCGQKAAFLPVRDFIFHNIDNVSREYEHQRIGALHAFGFGKTPVLTAPVEAMMLSTMPPDVMEKAALRLCMDEDYDLNDLASRLTEAGYTNTLTVEGPGQFALRGGILDVFPVGQEAPVRAEFFGDTVDSLGIFDPMTQRRSRNIDACDILPARETLPHMAKNGIDGLVKTLNALSRRAGDELRTTLQQDAERLTQNGLFAACDRYLPHIYPRQASAFSYLPPNTVIIVDDTPAVLESARAMAYRQSEDQTHLLEGGVLAPSKCGFCLSDGEVRGIIESHTAVLLDAFLSQTALRPQALIALGCKQLPSYGGSLDTAVSDLESYLSMRYTLFALAGGSQRAASLHELLESRGLPCVTDAGQAGPGRICILPQNLSAGFEYPYAMTAVITEGQLGVQRQKRKKEGKKDARSRLKSYTDLTPGDLVVHDHHGIGRFCGVERITVDGVQRDYIKIAYAGTDVVFVPATSLDLVSKYIGAGEADTVKLSKLGGTAWQKTKSRAKKAAQDLAAGLIALYSARMKRPGFAFFPDDDMQLAFEESFPYDETEDQLTCARDIKRDMEKPHPMDRLLCGDVGFGKTEVAFRAVMKCVLSGKQAAILVPTTVLARQHYLTACQRFSGYPVKIEMMSRYRTAGQMRETLYRLRTGQCDVLIGTHRILQKDVHFKDLGLLVVDEEQRFGVSHKEQIKQMTTSVDVLTLTATPIPRTLNMALSGIRDMSVLEEPPLGRQPVQTYVLEHDNAIIRDAIRRELSRGGQVYYLHNRIDSIEQTASFLRQQFPDAVVATAHGRMSEEQLSDVMSRTYAGEVSILVCTTIIETGVDIPNVNTLVIENADAMGLAQLHQIRGRVGRSARHAYAYFTYRRGKVLSEISQKRLSAIREFAEFGSGFKIAMRDLEIRGAGNVLGAEQSGHLMNVGYDLYLRLLEEAAGELSGQPSTERTECTADILVSASLPQSYIPDTGTRVDLYRRIALIRSEEDHLDLQDELIDRFGDPPQPVLNLLAIALLRAHASECGVSEINHRSGSIQFVFTPSVLQSASAVCADPSLRGRILMSAGEKPYLSLRLKPSDDVLKSASGLIALWKGKAEEIRAADAAK